MRKSGSLFALFVLAACAPDLPNDGGIVTEPRVLAIKAEPPEAKPGTLVTYDALVALPLATTSDALALVWDFCTAPKPPTEDNVVSSACLGASALVPAGSGTSITAATPPNACALFGPDTPPGGFRPRDPDATGGYYQPLRVSLDDQVPGFALERLQCDLGQASADVATAFAAAYTANTNPSLLPLSASVNGNDTPFDAVHAGAHVTLRASWPAEDAETFAYFDRDTQRVTSEQETLRVAWYATAGHFDATATGPNDGASSTTNLWTAPARPGDNVLWVVLHDSRGGVDFARYDVNVTP